MSFLKALNSHVETPELTEVALSIVNCLLKDATLRQLQANNGHLSQNNFKVNFAGLSSSNDTFGISKLNSTTWPYLIVNYFRFIGGKRFVNFFVYCEQPEFRENLILTRNNLETSFITLIHLMRLYPMEANRNLLKGDEQEVFSAALANWNFSRCRDIITALDSSFAASKRGFNFDKSISGLLKTIATSLLSLEDKALSVLGRGDLRELEKKGVAFKQYHRKKGNVEKFEESEDHSLRAHLQDKLNLLGKLMNIPLHLFSFEDKIDLLEFLLETLMETDSLREELSKSLNQVEELEEELSLLKDEVTNEVEAAHKRKASRRKALLQHLSTRRSFVLRNREANGDAFHQLKESAGRQLNSTTLYTLLRRECLVGRTVVKNINGEFVAGRVDKVVLYGKSEDYLTPIKDSKKRKRKGSKKQNKRVKGEGGRSSVRKRKEDMALNRNNTKSFKCIFDNGSKFTAKKGQIYELLVPFDSEIAFNYLEVDNEVYQDGLTMEDISQIYTSSRKALPTSQEVLKKPILADIRSEDEKQVSPPIKTRIVLEFRAKEEVEALTNFLLAFYEGAEPTKATTILLKEAKIFGEGEGLPQEILESIFVEDIYEYESLLLFKLYESPSEEDGMEHDEYDGSYRFKEGLSICLRHKSIVFTLEFGFCVLLNPSNEFHSSVDKFLVRPINSAEPKFHVVSINDILFKRVTYEEYKLLSEFEINLSLCEELYIINNYCNIDDDQISSVDNKISSLLKNLRFNQDTLRNGTPFHRFDDAILVGPSPISKTDLNQIKGAIILPGEGKLEEQLQNTEIEATEVTRILKTKSRSYPTNYKNMLREDAEVFKIYPSYFDKVNSFQGFNMFNKLKILVESLLRLESNMIPFFNAEAKLNRSRFRNFVRSIEKTSPVTSTDFLLEKSVTYRLKKVAQAMLSLETKLLQSLRELLNRLVVSKDDSLNLVGGKDNFASTEIEVECQIERYIMDPKELDVFLKRYSVNRPIISNNIGLLPPFPSYLSERGLNFAQFLHLQNFLYIRYNHQLQRLVPVSQIDFHHYGEQSLDKKASQVLSQYMQECLKVFFAFLNYNLKDDELKEIVSWTRVSGVPNLEKKLKEKYQDHCLQSLSTLKKEIETREVVDFTRAQISFDNFCVGTNRKQVVVNIHRFFHAWLISRSNWRAILSQFLETSIEEMCRFTPTTLMTSMLLFEERFNLLLDNVRFNSSFFFHSDIKPSQPPVSLAFHADLFALRPGDLVHYMFKDHKTAINEEVEEREIVAEQASIDYGLLGQSQLYLSEKTYLDVFNFFCQFHTFQVYFVKFFPGGGDPYLIVTLGPVPDSHLNATAEKKRKARVNKAGLLEEESDEDEAEIDVDTRNYSSSWTTKINAKNGSSDTRCFISGAGGSLILCDVGKCPRAYKEDCLQQLVNLKAHKFNNPDLAEDIARVDQLRCPVHDLQKGFRDYLNFDPATLDNPQESVLMERDLQRTCLNYIILRVLDEVCALDQAHLFILPQQNLFTFPIIKNPIWLRDMRLQCLANAYDSEQELLEQFRLLNYNAEVWSNHTSTLIVPFAREITKNMQMFLKKKKTEVHRKKEARREQIMRKRAAERASEQPQLLTEQPLLPKGKTNYSEVDSKNVVPTSRRRISRTKHFGSHNQELDGLSDDEEIACGNCSNCLLNAEYDDRMFFKCVETGCQRGKEVIPLRYKFNIGEKFDSLVSGLMHVGSGGKQLENSFIDLAKVWDDFNFPVRSSTKDLFNITVPLSRRFTKFLSKVS